MTHYQQLNDAIVQKIKSITVEVKIIKISNQLYLINDRGTEKEKEKRFYRINNFNDIHFIYL